MAITADQTIAMRSMFRQVLSGNYPGQANPSEGEMLGFLTQILADSAGTAALPPRQQIAVAAAMRDALSGNLARAPNPSDAQVIDFFAQLITSASGAAPLATPRYSAILSVLRDKLSNNYPGTINPTDRDIRSYFSTLAFTGQFLSLFPNAYHITQTDIGLIYGGVLLATAGNTSATIITLGGAIIGLPVAVMVKATNSLGVGTGGTFDVYYDGGTTPAMVGLVPVGGAFINLTGAGAGLNLTWTAATSVNGDTWKARCAGLTDQTLNAKNATAPSLAAQPVITPGLNGKVGLLFDGVANKLTSLAHALITALPYQAIVVGRIVGAISSTQTLLSTDGFIGPVIAGSAANVIQAYNSVNGLTNPFASNAPTRFAATFTGSTSDVFLAGNQTRTGVNAGPEIPSHAGRIVYGAWDVFVTFGNVEIFAVILCPPTALASFEAAINSPQGYGVGAIAV